MYLYTPGKSAAKTVFYEVITGTTPTSSMEKMKKKTPQVKKESRDMANKMGKIGCVFVTSPVHNCFMM